MAGYRVIVARRVDRQLLTHVEFITRVSIPAARRFQFPSDTDPNLPEDLYHKAIFARWYKALFMIDTSNRIVYLDAVVDCRQSTDSYEI